jgi:hypothetical protein
MAISDGSGLNPVDCGGITSYKFMYTGTQRRKPGDLSLCSFKWHETVRFPMREHQSSETVLLSPPSSLPGRELFSDFSRNPDFLVFPRFHGTETDLPPEN